MKDISWKGNSQITEYFLKNRAETKKYIILLIMEEEIYHDWIWHFSK